MWKQPPIPTLSLIPIFRIDKHIETVLPFTKHSYKCHSALTVLVPFNKGGSWRSLRAERLRRSSQEGGGGLPGWWGWVRGGLNVGSAFGSCCRFWAQPESEQCHFLLWCLLSHWTQSCGARDPYGFKASGSRSRRTVWNYGCVYCIIQGPFGNSSGAFKSELSANEAMRGCSKLWQQEALQ